jgi:hypothetical protein
MAAPSIRYSPEPANAADYCVATTVSCVAAATVAWGEVVLQVTLPAAFAQLYHDPPAASCALTVVAAVGAIVKATWSRFVGVVAFNVYATLLIVYPLIVPDPAPAVLPGTVLVAA